MAGRILVDANLLVYAHDRTEPEKQAQALYVLDQVQREGVGALTTQILAEFFVLTTRKIPAPLTSEDAARQAERFARTWTVIPITSFTVLEALRGCLQYQMPYWDSQIWASARLSQIPLVFSEDFNTGAILEGVRFVNPFAPDFDIVHFT